MASSTRPIHSIQSHLGPRFREFFDCIDKYFERRRNVVLDKATHYIGWMTMNYDIPNRLVGSRPYIGGETVEACITDAIAETILIEVLGLRRDEIRESPLSRTLRFDDQSSRTTDGAAYVQSTDSQSTEGTSSSRPTVSATSLFDWSRLPERTTPGDVTLFDRFEKSEIRDWCLEMIRSADIERRPWMIELRSNVRDELVHFDLRIEYLLNGEPLEVATLPYPILRQGHSFHRCVKNGRTMYFYQYAPLSYDLPIFDAYHDQIVVRGHPSIIDAWFSRRMRILADQLTSDLIRHRIEPCLRMGYDLEVVGDSDLLFDH